MSLHRLKESLHDCCSSQPQSQPRSPPPAPLLPRRPPKSSLSQQLLRLEAVSSDFSSLAAPPPPAPKPPAQKPREDAAIESPSDEKDEDARPLCRRRPAPAPAVESRGPYEPLVLSPPGERPLVQTIQTIAFLSAVIEKGNDHGEQSTDQRKKSGPVLILCPTSVIRNWENEFSEWAEFSVAVYHGPNRDLVLERIETQGLEVLITSFDTFRIHDKILCGISWELVVVDEAHRLKNEKSKLYEACLGITTQKRFGLTGTIMQNKIMELFNLFDWFVPGCLGDREHFRAYYDEPLKHGQRVSAPERFVQVADTRKKHLVSVLKKFLLRRTKEETIGHLMLGKEDNIIFCKMSDVQKRVYRRMLQQPDIQILINKDLPCSCGSPLTQISNHLELIKPNPKDDIEKQKKDAELAAAVIGSDIDLVDGCAKSENFMSLSDAEHCGKMRALEMLLSLWTQQGDKILLFSYSVRMTRNLKVSSLGICNLFRDLSDKLFTSEIIEMHGDDGIVYAHRNEDVVNMRTNGRNDCAIDQMIQSSAEELENKHETTKLSVMAKSYSMEQKKEEFSRIASFMGMSDLEFSKWLLTASPQQRSEVLKNYKRKKNRKYHRNHK
ncbi:hypothetical protein PR202_gb11548 [Eleusine coracana subsp. coracana]|uniref:Helicase ATP-binding domain-containing protein n=1 Tax=Eleusine coracana subsp. coracana TaxID=191504 RepID=A0AAV5EN97_ELECO|nr:hypothetical protein PR202_gb11548 [Eleusine coracana subsp. coracana]